jgi:hypothetical protein
MTREEKVKAKRFCDALKEMVHMQYCLGGASPDEIKAATVDFLFEAGYSILRTIENDVEVPSAR